MVLIIQHMRMPRIEIAVGKVEPTGGVLGEIRVLDIGIGLLGVKEDGFVANFAVCPTFYMRRYWACDRSCSWSKVEAACPGSRHNAILSATYPMISLCGEGSRWQ